MNYEQYQAHLELEEEFTAVCRVALKWVLNGRLEESQLLLTLFRDYAGEREKEIANKISEWVDTLTKLG
jgi:hypothetical protein